MELPGGVLTFYVLNCANLTDEQTYVRRFELTWNIEEAYQESYFKFGSGGQVQSGYFCPIVILHGWRGLCWRVLLWGGSRCRDRKCRTWRLLCSTRTIDTPVPVSSTKSRRGGSFSQWGATMTSGPHLNTPDEFGNPSRCSFCKSTYHYDRQCPDAAKQALRKSVHKNQDEIQLLKGSTDQPKCVPQEDDENEDGKDGEQVIVPLGWMWLSWM